MKCLLGRLSAYSPRLWQIELADGFWQRFIGLMGRRNLAPDRGMLLRPCSSVHMLFMRFSIDVVYLSREGTIVKVVSKLPPWRGASFCNGAAAALELPAGSVVRQNLHIGQKIDLWAKE